MGADLLGVICTVDGLDLIKTSRQVCLMIYHVSGTRVQTSERALQHSDKSCSAPKTEPAKQGKSHGCFDIIKRGNGKARPGMKGHQTAAPASPHPEIGLVMSFFVSFFRILPASRG